MRARAGARERSAAQSAPRRQQQALAAVGALEVAVLEREGLGDVTVELGVAHVPDTRAEDVTRVKRAIEKAGFEVAT